MRPLINPPRPTRRSVYFGILITVIIFAFGILVDSLQARFTVSGWALWLDEAVGATTVGCLIYIYERRREKELSEKLKVIELMNHHVRNALQPVMYLPYSDDKEEKFKTIEDAVSRIDWALREILPGAGEEDQSSSNAA